jgi:hypothetical protein
MDAVSIATGELDATHVFLGRDTDVAGGQSFGFAMMAYGVSPIVTGLARERFVRVVDVLL